MRDARKLAKALNNIQATGAQVVMASVLLKFCGIDVALEFVHNLPVSPNRLTAALKGME